MLIHHGQLTAIGSRTRKHSSEHRILLETLDKRYLKYNQVLDDLENKYTGIDIIYPPEDFKVKRLTVDEKRILIGFEQGISAGKQFLIGKA